MRSLRSTITLITVLVILTSIIAVSGANHVIIWNETTNNSVDTMNLICTGTERLLENYFESIRESVDIVANIATEDFDSVLLVEEGIIGQKAKRSPKQISELDEYLSGYTGGLEDLFQGVADNTQGVISFYYCLDPGLSRNEHGFFYMKKGKAGLIEQPPMDAFGLDVNEGLETSWYDTAVAMGSPGWIGPYVCQGVWVCSYMVPIYKAGILIGVMGVDVSCETLSSQVQDIRLYRTGFVCLLDEEGRIIYHPEAPLGSSFDWLETEIQDRIIQADNSGEELIRYIKNGQERQLSFSTLSNGMKLCCIVPVDEISASWRTLLWGTTLTTAVIILIFVLIIFFVMDAITRPLKVLTDASQKLADSDYDVDLTYKSKNEIGALTDAFRKMRDHIKDNIADLNHQIYYDRLTDLPNMRAFFDLAVSVRDQLCSEGKEPLMVYINMIGVRNYNRRYGFKKGDKLMVDFAGVLLKHFGENRVCRFNGDRFAAVADDSTIDGILDNVLADCATIMDGSRLHIRVGIYPNKLEVVDTDVACDRAKYACDRKKGELSSSITYYDEEMLRQSEIDQHIINNLDRALSEGWVKVYYQPIIRAVDGKICDEEALARWIDPELGFLAPGYFIPALEQSKLIYKLDLYVVEEVLKKIKRMQEDGFYPVSQSINLSRMDFESCDIVEEIRRRVDEAGIERSKISVEITESVIGGNFEFMKKQIDRFRSLGFPVWMDDFGSGYSSLDVLHQIHFDLIKFDMRFMERFNESEASSIILTQMVNMAVNLGIETLCEGVEEAEQAEFLREIGCTRIQGYYYGKALPYEEIIKMMKKESALEFEDPKEAEYYGALGRVNLYDFASLSGEDAEQLNTFFETIPVCIMEVNGTNVRYNRCNRSYRDFLSRTLNVEYYTTERDSSLLPDDEKTIFIRKIVQCGHDGRRVIVDEKVSEDTYVHALIRRIAVNPVNGVAAVAVAVLAVRDI